MPKDNNEDELKSQTPDAEEQDVQDSVGSEVENVEDATAKKSKKAKNDPEQNGEELKEAEVEPVAEKVQLDEEPQGTERPNASSRNVEAVTVQPAEFISFDNDANPSGEENKNLEMLLDIKLELTVELGRCELPIKKILELTRDSIVELDKIAGEPVSLYANGKHIANGEVVVIEDNFGLRITSIIEPEKRLKSLE